MSKGQLVSVILTTRNEQDVIKRVLLSIVRQTYKNIEIILIDNNSKDRTYEIAKVYTKKVFNFGPERSAQRNFGAKQAKGEYLLFLDADMRLTKNVLLECVKLIKKDSKIGAVTILEESKAKTFWEKIKAYERSFYNLEGDVITDAARFFPTRIFKQVGGYDESITGPEDWDLTDNIIKLGYKIEIAKSLIYHYEYIPSIFALVKKKFYYGLKSHRYLFKQQVSIISPKTVYFLRPIFYRRWKRLFQHPVLTTGLLLMLIIEQMSGMAGYLCGRITRQ